MRTLALTATVVLFAAGAGCRKKAPNTSVPDPVPAAPSAPNVPSAPSVPAAARTANPVTMPSGWAVYTPPEKDFSVAAPGTPRVETVPQQGETVRVYTFRKGTTVLRAIVSERTGARPQWAQPDAVKSDPDIVRGSLKELPAAKGFARAMEFRRTDPRDGLVLSRSYWSAGNGPDVGLSVLKPDAVPADQTSAFLDSFAFHGR